MTRSLLIVGAGPAAAGAALAAVAHPEVQVTVIDVGGRLEDDNDLAVGRLAGSSPDGWSAEDLATITRQPVASAVKGLPEKRAFGSDFPFRDFGQRQGLTAEDGANSTVISGAYGGFSNVWGAQVMPFTAATFRAWPVDWREMYAHYAAVLEQIPYAAEEDDLATLFPLLAPSSPLPRLSPRSDAVLAGYRRHRERLIRHGVSVGRARLAMQSSDCVLAGLCLTGCPYSLVYSASQTLDGLRRTGQIAYHGGLLAVRVEEGDAGAAVVARELHSGRLQRFAADRVLLACGAIGTSRLVMGSLELFDRSAAVSESAQFMLPFASRSSIPDPQHASDFTLNQFNMVLTMDEDGYDVSQLHFYTYNQTFLEALPSPLRSGWARTPRTELMRRLTVALGYLPSWSSPRFFLRAAPAPDPASPAAMAIHAERPGFATNRMLRRVLGRVAFSAPYLDLWPVLPMLRMSARGKSYHWGGTFPHSATPSGRFSSDVLGRVQPWTKVHLVDASVFPTVPATTFTLGIMANAHRIAETALRELG